MSKSIHVRLPDDLHAELARDAKALGISLNALIVLALRRVQEEKHGS